MHVLASLKIFCEENLLFYMKIDEFVAKKLQIIQKKFELSMILLTLFIYKMLKAENFESSKFELSKFHCKRFIHELVPNHSPGILFSVHYLQTKSTCIAYILDSAL